MLSIEASDEADNKIKKIEATDSGVFILKVDDAGKVVPTCW